MKRFLAVHPEALVPTVNVLVRVLPGAGKASLERNYPQAIFHSEIGGVVTAEVPISLLDAFESDPDIVRVEHSARRRPNLDVVRSTFQTGGLYLGVLESTSDLNNLNGSGVVIGFVETGIDLTHADFKSGGQTRILDLWDQTLSTGPGTPPFPAGFNYGVECSPAVINAGMCGETDTDGHGTHVSGIAAGNGQATGNGVPAGAYTGIAKSADIILVKSDFTDGGIIDAMNYIVARAKSLGKRAVVNMSLGGQDGPHDGTDAFETAIGAVAASTPVAVAMGNDTGNSPHAFFTVASGGSATPVVITTTTLSNSSYSKFIITEFWYPAADDYALTVSVAGGPAGSASFAVEEGGINGVTKQIGSGASAVFVTVLNDTNGTGATRELFIQIDDQGHGGLTSASYQLTRSVHAGSGQVDGYTDPTSLGTSFSNAWAASNGTLTEPASANNVFSVAAYTTKNSWIDLAGQSVQYATVPPLGQIASFSGIGPTRDGRQKPDIAAPGQGVASSLSAQSSPNALNIVQDGKHVIDQGTSMATPVLSGSLALMLQINPGWTVSQLRTSLQSTARSDAGVTSAGAVPNLVWGYGKLLAVPKVQSAPTALSVATLGTTSITWNWSLVQNATSYFVFNASPPNNLLATASNGSMTLTGLTPGASYQIQVEGENAGGTGPAAILPSTATLANPPVAPFALAVLVSSITVSFTPITGAFGYVFSASTASNFSGTVISSSTGSQASTALSASGLASLTTYYLRLGTLNAVGGLNFVSLSSVTTSLVAVSAPGVLPPTNVTSTQIQFNWNQGSNSAGISYATQLSTASDFSGTVQGALGIDFFSELFTGLAVNTSYYFRVTAGGNFSASAGPYATLAAQPVPAVPTFSFVFLSSMTVAWGAGSNPGGTPFQVQVGSDPNYASGTFSSISTANSSVALTGLAPNTTYYARVEAINRGGYPTSFVNLGAVSTLADPPPAGAAFLSVTYTSVTAQYPTLPLAPASASCEGYSIQLSTDPAFGGTLVGAVVSGAGVSQGGVSGLAFGTTYYLRVGSLNWGGVANFTVMGSTRTLIAIESSGTVSGAGLTLSLIPQLPVITSVQLIIPPGILPAGTSVTLNSSVELTLPLPATNEAIIKALTSGEGFSIDDGGVQPSGSAQVLMTYNPALLPAGSDPKTIQLARYDDGARQWTLLPTSVNSSLNSITAQINHFSFYAPFLIAAAGGLGAVNIFPIPWEPNSSNGLLNAAFVTFSNLPSGARVRLFSIGGELIWEADAGPGGTLAWNGVNRSGREVGSGVYPVVIDTGGSHVLKRLAIVR